MQTKLSFKHFPFQIAIVANKRDLETGREVNESEGRYFTESLNSDHVTALYFETTSKDKEDISKVFTGILGRYDMGLVGMI